MIDTTGTGREEMDLNIDLALYHRLLGIMVVSLLLTGEPVISIAVDAGRMIDVDHTTGIVESVALYETDFLAQEMTNDLSQENVHLKSGAGFLEHLGHLQDDFVSIKGSMWSVLFI